MLEPLRPHRWPGTALTRPLPRLEARLRGQVYPEEDGEPGAPGAPDGTDGTAGTGTPKRAVQPASDLDAEPERESFRQQSEVFPSHRGHHPAA